MIWYAFVACSKTRQHFSLKLIQFNLLSKYRRTKIASFFFLSAYSFFLSRQPHQNHDQISFIFYWAKMVISKHKGLFSVKKAGIPPDYNRKQCIKPPRTRQINSPTSLFRFHQDPGLHIFHTRISRILPPGSEETFQVAFGKRVACIHEKMSLFIYFISTSEYIYNFIECWYIIPYWFHPWWLW